MAKRGGGQFRGFRKLDAGHIASLTVRTYVCCGCGAQHADRMPPQCLSCGRMDFYKFDAKGEANRWADLLLRQRANLISNLQRQVRFPLMAHGPAGRPALVGHYVADFVYDRDGQRVVEDTKGGGITDLASWKLRHFEAQHGFSVTLIKV